MKKGGEKMEIFHLHKKHFFIIFISLFFGLGIVLISAIRVGQAEVLAQTGMEKEEIVAINEEEKEERVIGEEASENNEEELVIASESGEIKSVVEIKTEKEVDYYLAYPGILPDHPLYWLKMIRDKIILGLTKKPINRFERLMLYADKRVGAAEALINGAKVELGVTTATKAEKYLEQAVLEFESMAADEKATPEMHQRIERAVLKHQEVLTKTLSKLSDQPKEALEKTLEKTQSNLERIKMPV